MDVPAAAGGERRRKVTPLFSEAVVIPYRILLVWVLFQNPLIDQAFQAVGQEVAGNAEAGLELVKP